MTFLNAYMLGALAVVAVPLLLHVLRRRGGEVVPWAAMQFLRAGLRRQMRRARLEELLLLLVRCAWPVLIVLAMARPMATTELSSPAASAGRDIALVMDCSLSMAATEQRKSTFQHALEQARTIISRCAPSDAVSVIAAGPAATAVIAQPTHDLAVAAAALDGLAPNGGSADILAAIDRAGQSLAKGHNQAKRIVVFTDGQLAAWRSGSEGQYRQLAETLGPLPSAEILFAPLELPHPKNNLAVGPIGFSRSIVGTDRPLTVFAEVRNTGQKPMTLEGVVASVDGTALPVVHVNRSLPPGASERVEVNHRFQTPGSHAVSMRLIQEDDFPQDDSAEAAISVSDPLKVLLVDGSTAARPAMTAAQFVAAALSPAATSSVVAGSPGGAKDSLFQVRAIRPEALAEIEDLSAYALLVLTDVPRLSMADARRVSEYVSRGGGMLVAPGADVDAEFYNSWKSAGEGTLLPGHLQSAIDDDSPANVALEDIHLEGLSKLSDVARYDLNRLEIRRHWRLSTDAATPPAGSAKVALDNGDALLLTRAVGVGRVAQLAIGLDAQWSNLPALRCFVPLVHELSYSLLPRPEAQWNISAGQPFVYSWHDFRRGPESAAATQPACTVLTPQGQAAPVEMATSADGPRIIFRATDRPGLYRLRMGGGKQDVLFAVLRDPQESVFEGVSEAEFTALQQALPSGPKSIPLRLAQNPQQLLAWMGNDQGGQELWPILALAALGLLIVEIALSRRIARRRELDRPGVTEFAAVEDVFSSGAAAGSFPAKPPSRREPLERWPKAKLRSGA